MTKYAFLHLRPNSGAAKGASIYDVRSEGEGGIHRFWPYKRALKGFSDLKRAFSLTKCPFRSGPTQNWPYKLVDPTSVDHTSGQHCTWGASRRTANARAHILLNCGYHTQCNRNQANLTNFHALIFYHLVTAEGVKSFKLVCNTWHHCETCHFGSPRPAEHTLPSGQLRASP